MHYYKKNIGDYYKKAGRLTMLQHGAYNMLIDSCYDREEFPTLEMAYDWVWASSKEEKEAVEFVLSKLFVIDGDVYVQEEIKDGLEKYHKNAKINKRIAKDREAKKRSERERTEHEPCTLEHEPAPNHKPLTTNQGTTNQGTTNQKTKKPVTQFIKPTLDQLKAHISEKGYSVDYEKFYYHYESNGWKVGKNKMKSWTAALANWNKGNNDRPNGKKSIALTQQEIDNTTYTGTPIDEISWLNDE
jgi:uncharacterized protein YdaU (DUF1376 family)